MLLLCQDWCCCSWLVWQKLGGLLMMTVGVCSTWPGLAYSASAQWWRVAVMSSEVVSCAGLGGGSPLDRASRLLMITMITMTIVSMLRPAECGKFDNHACRGSITKLLYGTFTKPVASILHLAMHWPQLWHSCVQCWQPDVLASSCSAAMTMATYAQLPVTINVPLHSMLLN